MRPPVRCLRALGERGPSTKGTTVHIKTVTEAQASSILAELGLSVVLWTTCRMENAKYQAIICDHTGIPGYAVKYSIAIYSLSGVLLGRMNVMH